MKRMFVLALALVLVLAMAPAVAMAETTVNSAAELTAALAAGGDIVLGADIDAGDLVSGTFFTVSGGNVSVLDLNGHTLQGTFTGTSNSELINNAGTLTVKDSAGGGQLVVDSTADASWSAYCAVISNTGTLNVESGTILNNGITSMSYAVDNRSGSGSPVLNISGGLLKSVNYIAVRQFTNSTTMTNTVNITGGTVYGKRRGIWIQQPSVSNGLGALNISGGTVEANLQAAVQADLLGTDGIDISVTGGSLINHSDTRATLALTLDGVPTAGGAYVLINGGQFSNTGTAGNIGDETLGGTATPSVIEVRKGRFSVLVPSEYIPADADLDDIVIGDDTDVTAGVDVSYIIVIPAAVDFGTLTKGSGTVTKNFEVTAEGVVLEDGARVEVEVAGPFVMKDQAGTGDVSLLYTLSNHASAISATGGTFTSFTEDRTEAGSIAVNTTNIVNAGSYKGTMMFSVSYEK